MSLFITQCTLIILSLIFIFIGALDEFIESDISYSIATILFAIFIGITACYT